MRTLSVKLIELPSAEIPSIRVNVREDSILSSAGSTTARPRLVAIQTRPFASATTERSRRTPPRLGRPSARPYSRTSVAVREPSCSFCRGTWITLVDVTIHRAPRRSSASPTIASRNRRGVFGTAWIAPALYTASPSVVPIHNVSVESSRRQLTLSDGRPSEMPYDFQRFCDHALNPFNVATQIVPSAVSATAETGFEANPFAAEKVVKWPFFH